MTKRALRIGAKERRAHIVTSMSAAERHTAAVAVAERVMTNIGVAKCVAAYLPIGSEIDTIPTIERLRAMGIAIALPQIDASTQTMRFVAWAHGERLVPGPLGVSQPAAEASAVEPDVILTPLLAFDHALNRLGYGAGFYDRAFAAQPSARRIGLAWHAQQVEVMPVDAWDVPLHAVATESTWIIARHGMEIA